TRVRSERNAGAPGKRVRGTPGLGGGPGRDGGVLSMLEATTVRRRPGRGAERLLERASGALPGLREAGGEGRGGRDELGRALPVAWRQSERPRGVEASVRRLGLSPDQRTSVLTD